MGLSTTYTKTETDYKLQELQKFIASGIKGTLKTTDTAPTTQGLYVLSDIGTYTNLGGLVTTTGKLNYAYFDGTTWKLIEVDMPKGEDGKTIENWTAKAFVAGSSVYYNNKIYTTASATLATDVPGVSAAWVEQLLNINKDIVQHTELQMISFGFTITTPIVNYWGTNEVVQYGNLTNTSSRFEKTGLIANQIFANNLTFYLIAEIYCDTAQTQTFQIYNQTTATYLLNVTKNLQVGLNTIVIPFKPTTANINTNSISIFIGKQIGAFYLRNVRFINSQFLPSSSYSRTLEMMYGSIVNFENSMEFKKLWTPLSNYTTNTTTTVGESNFINAKVPQGTPLKIYVKAQYTGRFTVYCRKDANASFIILDIPNADFSSGKNVDITVPSGDYNLLSFRTWVSGVVIDEISFSNYYIKNTSLPSEFTTSLQEIQNKFVWNKFLTPVLNYTPNITTNFLPTYLADYNIPKLAPLKIYVKAQYTGRFTLYAQQGTGTSVVLLDVTSTDFTLGQTFDFTIPSGLYDNISYRTHQAGILVNEISILKNEVSSISIPQAKPLSGLKWASLGDSVTAVEIWQKKIEELTGLTPYVRGCGSSAITFSIGQMAVKPDGYYIDRRNLYASDSAFIAGINAKGYTNQITSVSWLDYSTNPSAYPSITSDATAYFLIDTQGNSTDRVNTIPLDSDIVSIMFYNDFQTWDDTTIGSINDYTINTSINSGRGTYIANLRQLIEKIKTRLPKAKIVLMVPYQKQDLHYDLVTKTLTAQGIGSEKMREAIRNVARTYGLYLIDLTKVINYNNYSLLLSDTIHPNEKGSKQIGYFVSDDFLANSNWLKNKIL